MTIVRSYAIGNGDMYYIRHNTDNFTVIDCSIPSERQGSILVEISTQSNDKRVHRFISTHPDQDHLSGLCGLDDHWNIVNFYCVKNNATKDKPTSDFERYCTLRDSAKAFHLYKGCTRQWMNQANEERGSAGLNIIWPITSDPDFQDALADAEAGMTPNNISCILKYSLNGGATMLWMGDLETDFMEKILGKVEVPKIDVLFAPHHGRTSGKVPKDWLTEMNPSLVVIGEAPSEYLHYYSDYNTLTQNSAGDVLFDCVTGKIHIYVGDSAYQVDYLHDDGLDHSHGLYYIGTLSC